jgi:hypothetical protein
MMLYALLLAPRYAVLRPQGTPAESKALIKITLSTRLVVFFTQCYSVVKNHPPSKASHLGGLSSYQLSAVSSQLSVKTKNSQLNAVSSAQSSAPSDLRCTDTEIFGGRC